MSQLRRLVGQTATYGVSSVLGRMLNYILVPYYTSIFLPEEYGVIVELYAIAAFLNIIYVYGMETSYFRFAAANKPEEKSIFNSAVTSIILTTLVLSGIFIILAPRLAMALEYPDHPNYIVWFALILGIDAIVAIPFARLRLMEKAKAFAIIKLANISINIGLNFFFLSFCKSVVEGKMFAGLRPFIETFYNPDLGVEYVFISNLIANALLFLMLWKSFSGLKLSISAHWWKSMLRYGYPLIFTGLAFVTNEMLSRTMLKYWLPENFYPGKSSMAALGIFGAVYKLSIFMALAVQAFRYAAEPFFFNQAAEKDAPQTFSKVMHGFILFGCFILFGISVNLDIFELLLRNETYREGIHVVPILLLANLFLGIYYNLSVWYKLTDRTYYGTWITIGGAVLTIALNYWLIPRMGYEGSALVTLLVYMSMAAACYWLGRKFMEIPYQVVRGLIYISISFGGIYLADLVVIHNNLLSHAFNILITLGFGGLIWYLEKDQFSG